MVASEFSRTPALNQFRGKDHNHLTNSVLLAGYGIKGNQQLGKSKVISRHNSPDGQSKHLALPLTNNFFIEPPHIAQLLHSIRKDISPQKRPYQVRPLLQKLVA
jgi:hypothetical protein